MGVALAQESDEESEAELAGREAEGRGRRASSVWDEGEDGIFGVGEEDEDEERAVLDRV